jgi:hypothetical protein
MAETDTAPQAEPDDANAAIAPLDPMLAEVEKALTTGDASGIVDVELTPEQQQLAIVERILRSQTLDEILASFEATSIDSVLGEPFEARRVRWERSEYEDGNPFYALIDAVMLGTGEQVTLTTGATNVLTQLFAMARKGYLPAKVVCVQSSKPTKSGFYPKHLERAQ